jgi:mannose/fructose/N-acetylgalactosamine-specific phosphotransferase system component IIC
MIVAATTAFRLRVHSRVVAGIGYAAALLLLFGSSSIPWLMLVFPVWVLVSVNVVVLSYRTRVRLAGTVSPG